MPLPYQQGDVVLIEARVVNVYHADREEAMQSLGLQLLGDGQALQTNPRNCRLRDAWSDVSEPEAKERKPAANKARRPKESK